MRLRPRPASSTERTSLHYGIIEALKAVLFGIVEGITEWLPISSTGHMMLLEAFVPLNVSPEFYSTFLVVIQLGAIMAVLVLFFHKLNPFSSRKTERQKRVTWGIWAKVVVGSIPAAIVGLLLDEWVETNIMTNEDVSAIVVAAALVIYGVIFILIEIRNRRRLAEAQSAAPHGKHARNGQLAETYESVDPDADTEYDASSIISSVNTFEQMSYAKAFIIGIFQSLAVIPGTSRSGSIIIGSMLVGTSRTVATEFAFFLAIPIMFGWERCEVLQARLRLHRHRVDGVRDRPGRRVRRLDHRDQVPGGLRQEARLHRVRRLPHHHRRGRAGVLPVHRVEAWCPPDGGDLRSAAQGASPIRVARPLFRVC